MIVRTLESVTGNESHLVGGGFENRRLLLCPDNPGYSFYDTLMDKYDAQFCARPRTPLRLVCGLRPALTGRESQDADGGYAVDS